MVDGTHAYSQEGRVPPSLFPVSGITIRRRHLIAVAMSLGLDVDAGKAIKSFATHRLHTVVDVAVVKVSVIRSKNVLDHFDRVSVDCWMNAPMVLIHALS